MTAPDNETNRRQHAWYCLRAQVKREHIAARFLANIEGVESYCPRISQIKKTRTGKKRFVEALFPGYLFAHFSLVDNYRRVIHTQGVSCMVENGRRKNVPIEVINELKATIPEGIVEAPDPSIEPGAKVDFVAGALQGLNGKVLARMNADNRIQILLEFLGRDLTITVHPDEIILAEKE